MHTPRGFSTELDDESDAQFRLVSHLRESIRSLTFYYGGRNRGPERRAIYDRVARLGITLLPHSTYVYIGKVFRIYDWRRPGPWETIKKHLYNERGRRCQHKGCTVGHGLEVHHINGMPWDNRRANLQILCYAHHRLAEGDIMPAVGSTRIMYSLPEYNYMMKLYAEIPKYTPGRAQTVADRLNARFKNNRSEQSVEDKYHNAKRQKNTKTTSRLAAAVANRVSIARARELLEAAESLGLIDVTLIA